MIIEFVLIFISGVYGIKFYFNSFNEDYLSKESTLSIKGLFVLFVFCRHIKTYVESTNLLDSLFYSIDIRIGQLIVVMFLFYSGFGIAKQIQIKNKDGAYIRTFLRHRLFPVWFRFAICVGFFVILDIINGDISQYSWRYILLSFTGYVNIGNSNWFMFVTFALYAIVYLSYRPFNFKNSYSNLIIMTVLSIILLIALYLLKGDDRSWWNTLLCFPLGMWYAYFQDKIEKHMRKPKEYYPTAIALLIVLLVLLALYNTLDTTGLSFIIVSLVFALVVVALTMKIKIGNKILDFFGKHIFSIYILQRIPMKIFKDVFSNKYLYLIVSFAITIAISVGYDYVCDNVKSLINRKRSALNKQ